MPQELAKKIRAKYPGVYDDLSDTELEAKILTKYPEYKDLVTSGEPSQEQGLIGKTWGAVTKPVVNLRGEPGSPIREATDQFAKEHPYIGGPANFAADVLSTTASPLNFALGGLGTGEAVAARFGLPAVARAAGIGRRVASAGMGVEGAQNVYKGYQSGSPEQTAGGVLEALGGLLGVRAPIHPKVGAEIPRVGEVPTLDPRVSGLPPTEIPKTITPTEPTSMAMDKTNKMFDALREERVVGKQLDRITVEKNAQPELPFTKIESPKETPIVSEIDPRIGGKVEPGVMSEPALLSPIEKLAAKLKESKPLNMEQAEIYKSERAEKFARAADVPITGQGSFFQRKGQLAGAHTKVSMEPLELSQEDLNSLYKTIGDAPKITMTDTIHAGDGLTKILEGRVPQESEIRILEKIFPAKVIDSIRGDLPKIDVKRNLVADILNVPRAMQSSYDLSFGGRQGITMIHTKAWWQSWGKAVQSWGSEKTFRGLMDSINDKPLAQRPKLPNGKLGQSVYERARLALTDLTEDLGKREENIQSTIAEKVPGIRQSNRAYTAAGNKLRSDNFDLLYARAEKIYETAKATGQAKRGFIKESFAPNEIEALNPATNDVLLREMGDYINAASGRGRLTMNIPKGLQKYMGGKTELSLERSAVILNATFFSPRLMASRLQMMNPVNYVFANPFIRKQYLKSMLALGSYWGTMAGLAKLSGAEVSLDPDNSDFGKIKIGNTRLDPAGGFQQYIVLAHRLMSGEYTSSTTEKTSQFGQKFGGQTRIDALTDFVSNKLAPIPSTIFSTQSGALAATRYQPFEVGDRAIRMFTPMVIQDLSEILQEDPSMFPLAIPGIGGVGTQTYGGKGQKNRLIPEDIFPRKSDIIFPSNYR